VDLTTWGSLAAVRSATDGPSGDRRRAVTEFVLSRTEVTDDRGLAGVEEVVVTLTTTHHGKAEYVGRPDRVYLTRLDYAKRVRAGGFTTSEYGLYSQASVLVQRADAARYSAKTLAQVHEAALAHLAAEYEHNAAFRSVFVEALDRHAR
jgi:hypothetical protein